MKEVRKRKTIVYANTYIWNLKKKNGYEEPRGWTGIKMQTENGLEDKGRGKGKLGRSDRVAWTCIYYEM